MSRNNIIEEISIEDLKNQISLQDVISKYVHLKHVSGRLHGLCPKHKEKTSSFVLDVNKGIYKCFGCGFGGNSIFSFIMEMENCDFKQAVNIIKNNHYNPNIIKKTNIIKHPIEEIEIKFVDGKYTDKHLEYWKFLEEDDKWLESKNIFAVKEWSMGTKSNMKKIAPTKDEITFAYYAPDIDKCKILRIGPYIDKKDKWRTSVNNTYIWSFEENKSIDEVLYICKSVKDALVLTKMGLWAKATQNESASILLNNNYKKLNELSNNIILIYGIDPQAIVQRDLILENTNWKSWNLNKILYQTDKIEDPSDYLQFFNYKQLEEELKNLIK